MQPSQLARRVGSAVAARMAIAPIGIEFDQFQGSHLSLREGWAVAECGAIASRCHLYAISFSINAAISACEHAVAAFTRQLQRNNLSFREGSAVDPHIHTMSKMNTRHVKDDDGAHHHDDEATTTTTTTTTMMMMMMVMMMMTTMMM
eukprot:6262681-Karenia_brevis.AAC.1